MVCDIILLQPNVCISGKRIDAKRKPLALSAILRDCSFERSCSLCVAENERKQIILYFDAIFGKLPIFVEKRKPQGPTWAR